MRFEEPYVGGGDFGGRLIAAAGRGGTEPRDMLGVKSKLEADGKVGPL